MPGAQHCCKGSVLESLDDRYICVQDQWCVIAGPDTGKRAVWRAHFRGDRCSSLKSFDNAHQAPVTTNSGLYQLLKDISVHFDFLSVVMHLKQHEHMFLLWPGSKTARRLWQERWKTWLILQRRRIHGCWMTSQLKTAQFFTSRKSLFNTRGPLATMIETH